MLTAIASTGNTLDSKVDSRFGRCSFFTFYDDESKKTEFLSNPNTNASGGAGPATVEFIANKGANRVVAGEFGVKIKSLIEGLNIQMVMIKEDKTIAEIIKMLNK